MSVDLSGNWVGEYPYDPPIVHAPVAFRLTLKQSWLGRFSGTVSDGDGGMPEMAIAATRTCAKASGANHAHGGSESHVA